MPTRLIGASRGDPLAPYLFDALERRYGSVDRIDTELQSWQRFLITLATFHPTPRRWKERFWKSHLAFQFRSRNCTSILARRGPRSATVVQVHTLFQTRGAPYVLYLDNTHQLSVDGWPLWNPFGARDLQRWYYHERTTYQQALHIFTMGEPTARSLVDFYGIPPERVSNVGGGANFYPLPPHVVTRREPAILFVGHDFRRKGGERLIEAFRQVRVRVPMARLWIVGAMNVSAEPGIEIFGRVDDRELLSQLYARASVFCLPSYFEPFGLVLAEAMAWGLPCVSTSVCAVPEIVAHGITGLLVPPGDSGALATALARLLEDPSYSARLGSAGRQKVEQSLTWDSVVERMAPVLDRLAGMDERARERAETRTACQPPIRIAPEAVIHRR